MIAQKYQESTSFSRQKNKCLPTDTGPSHPSPWEHGTSDASTSHFSCSSHQGSAPPEPEFPLNFPFTYIFVAI